jgi:hypothetical protein
MRRSHERCGTVRPPHLRDRDHPADQKASQLPSVPVFSGRGCCCGAAAAAALRGANFGRTTIDEYAGSKSAHAEGVVWGLKVRRLKP